MGGRGSSSTGDSKKTSGERITSKTFGRPIEVVIKNKKRLIRVDAEIDSNSVHIQSGSGKSSDIKFIIDDSKSISKQIPSLLKKALTETQYQTLIKNIKKALDYIK